MGWFDWLRATPAPILDHPRFGRVRASHRPRGSDLWLWEVLAPVATEYGPLDMTFDADEHGPSEAHEGQLEEVLSDRDILTRAAAPLVSTDLSDFLGQPFPDNPWDELVFEFVHLSGRKGEFEMAYSCKSWPDAHVTAYFQDGLPTAIQIDD